MPTDSALQFVAAARVAAMTGDSRATFYRRLSAGYFPQPIRCGSRAVRWNLATVTEYLTASERAGRLLTRAEWEAMQALAERQEKLNAMTRQTSSRSNIVRHSSPVSEVAT